MVLTGWKPEVCNEDGVAVTPLRIQGVQETPGSPHGSNILWSNINDIIILCTTLRSLMVSRLSL